jgi:Protein of unknown function DUF262
MTFDSNTQPVSWFNDRHLDGSLEIRPPFQRKPIWAAKQKSFLIESILLQLPIPEIYMQQITSEEGKTTYAIVDGQQRIRTVLQFIGSEKDPEQLESNKFALDKLPAESSWRNKTFADLTPDEKRRFYGYKFCVRNLNTDDESEVRNMFGRLNQFQAPLKPQELRHAIFTGPFVKLAERLADDGYWAENKIMTAAAIRRMADVEFISELLIGTIHGPQSGSAAVIDQYYVNYEDYDDEFPNQKKAAKLFLKALDAVKTLFPEIKETRWGNKTDFYTLFVALASYLSERNLATTAKRKLRRLLDKLESEVDERLRDEDADVNDDAIEYVRAVEKGANDKHRRGTRHAIVLRLIENAKG